MITRFAPLFLTLTVASSVLVGCGALPGSTGAAALSVAGKGMVKVGDNGESPALLKRANGEWLMVFVGTNVANRRLFWSTSTDGARWSAPKAIETAVYSDQAPALVEDANGTAHLFFASNRDGNDFELYHARFTGTWDDSEKISGYTGIQDLAAAYANGRFLLAAEVMTEGLFASASADGASFTEREQVASAGFEPAATFLPDGTALVAYTRGDDLVAKASAPGADWADETVVATTTSRMRGPALAWAGDHGKLVFAERNGATYSLREKRFDSTLKFTDGKPLTAFGGEANSPALALDHNGKIGLAWGMKLSSSQQGIAFTLDGWK